MVGETDTILWRVIDHYVPKARAAVDMADVQAVGIEETSSRRGHDTITLFVDLNARRLLFATPGKDAKTIEQFANDLQAHGGSAEAITDVSMDLSPAFQKGAKEHLPNAQITFDSQITNGILEGFNSLIQSAKTKARGYRSHKNFINMAYLVLGRLYFQLPT
jgi:transposase